MSETEATTAPTAPAVVLPTVVQRPEAQFDYVSPAAIIVPQMLLRDAQVTEDSYAVMRNSIAASGQRYPILVTRGTEPGTYVLSDGMQRLSIIKELGIDKIFIRIEEMNDSEMVESQMEMNLAKVNTKLSDYSKLLVKYAQKFPTKTKKELAARIGVSTAFLDDRLNFTRLCPEIQQLADESTIGLSKAVLLAGLDPEVQKEFIERAATLQIDQFAKAVSARKTELAKAKAEGRSPRPEEYIPSASLRNKVEIIAESDGLTEGLAACASLETALDGWAAGVKWTLKLDPKSIAEGKQKWDEAKKQQDERKERMKQERERKAREAEAAIGAGTRG